MFTENKFSHLHNLRNYIKFFTHSLYLFCNNKDKFTRKSFCKCFDNNNDYNQDKDKNWSNGKGSNFQSWMENSNKCVWTPTPPFTPLWIISNNFSGETKFWLQIIIRIKQVFGWKLLTDPPNFTNKSALSPNNNPYFKFY